MMRLDDFIDIIGDMDRISSGVLYINIYPVVSYPRKLRISRLPYNESFSPGKWRKRVGNMVYYYGSGIKAQPVEVDIDNSLFGMIFRKYLLDILSEKVATPWQLKELRSTLRIVKEITESYNHSQSAWNPDQHVSAWQSLR